jgi:long-chain fatty acid transport protein
MSTANRAAPRAVAAACLLIMLVVPAAARAQRANYADLQIGARAAAMGGAFTAVADDSSATFHNPAGLSQLEEHGLSLSVQAYGFQRSVIDGLIRSGGESVDQESDSILFFPSATGYVLPAGGGEDWNHTVALSVAIRDFFEFEGVQELSLTETLLDLDLFQQLREQILYVGPTYSVRFGRFHLGASVFLQYATQNLKRSILFGLGRMIDADIAILRSNNFEFTKVGFFGLTGNVGFLYRPTDRISIGLSAELPNVRVGGKATTFYADATSLVTLDAMGMPIDVSLYQDVFRDVEGDSRYRTPASLSVGFAYRLPDVVTLAADLDLFFPLDAFDFIDADPPPPPIGQPGELPGLEDGRGFEARVRDPGREFVVNGALGADITLTEAFSLQLGLYTDFSAVPDDGIGDILQIDHLGYSVGVTRVTDDSSLTIGVYGRWGRGQAGGIEDQGDDFVPIAADATQWSITAFLAGHTTLFGGDEEECDDEEHDDADDAGDDDDDGNTDADDATDGNTEADDAGDGADHDGTGDQAAPPADG